MHSVIIVFFFHDNNIGVIENRCWKEFYILSQNKNISLNVVTLLKELVMYIFFLEIMSLST